MIKATVGKGERRREARLVITPFLLLLPELERGAARSVLGGEEEGVAMHGPNLFFFRSPPSRFVFKDDNRRLSRDLRVCEGDVVLLSDGSDDEPVNLEGEKGKLELLSVSPSATNYPAPTVVISPQLAALLGTPEEKGVPTNPSLLTSELHNLITETDVWRAIRLKKKLLVRRWQKITPAAEELGKHRNIFVYE